MNTPETGLLAAKNLLAAAKTIVILSHRSPDGDTVGANLALRRALKYQWGKTVISACVDPLPENSLFLPETDAYVSDFDPQQANAIVTVDCGARYMTRFHETKPALFSGNPPVINIDHHASNDFFGTVNIVETDAASATQVLHRFLKFCGFTIDRPIATCLLHGLYYDTGSFMHSNTTPEALTCAADLLWKGADFKTIVRRQFQLKPTRQLKLYGRIFERARVNDKKITVVALAADDFDATGATPDDATGAIDYLNSVPDARLCCLIYEERGGAIKGSLRTREEKVDLSRLAGLFGGGGHKKAAGFGLSGHLRQADRRITIEDA